MTKQQILSEVIKMRDLWQKAIEIDSNLFYKFLYINKIYKGFCFYIKSIFDVDEYKLILNELSLDLEVNRHLFNDDYYYPVYMFITNFNNIRIIQLQPRLDHLNRTIARLEKEIAIENSKDYSLEQHKDYINNQLAQIDSLTQYSEQTREEIKTSLWKVLDEIEFQINKINLQSSEK